VIARGCAMRLGFSRDASGERSILAWASLRAQARPREATTHDPPQAPAPRPYHPKAAAGPGRSEPWRRTNLSLAHRAKAPILPRASSARAGSVPRSHHPRPTPSASPTIDPPQGGSGTEPERALEANQPLPRAPRESSNPPQSLLSPRRLGPAKPSHTPHPKRQPNDQPTLRRQRDRAEV